MNIRRAKTSDASSLAAISIEVWVSTYLRNGVNRFFADYALDAFTSANFEALITDPRETLWVSENTGGIDGFARLTADKAAPVSGCSDVELTTLYVQPRHKGKGVGSALLQRTLPFNPWLATNAENTPAIGFYLAQGFERVGETHFEIADQAYLNHVFSYRGG